MSSGHLMPRVGHLARERDDVDERAVRRVAAQGAEAEYKLLPCEHDAVRWHSAERAFVGVQELNQRP